MMTLKPLPLTMLTTNEIKPEGWLKNQLRIQAQGLSGNLDKMWPDVRDSRWIGGEKEGWERVPYWLDGFIPLAYLLDDADMKLRAKKYVDAILKGQSEDGWICPCTQQERKSYDVWALFLIAKVLVVYHDCTQDERIEETLYRALKNLRSHINFHTLFNWAAARWYECLIPIYWLYERRPEPWLIELAKILAGEGIDYCKLFELLHYKNPEEKRHWSFTDHVVNIAMALKAEALFARVAEKGDENERTKRMLEKIRLEHGTVTGHFTGDECLSGDSPIQGTECCGVVEAMYSYEHLLSLTGDSYWGDQLERLAFNALPATLSPDMWTHQYVQMTNQIACTRIPEEETHFNSNNGEAHLFGLEPHFGCCTANFNQGWPKFALSTFMKTANGLAVTAFAPATACISVDGVRVCCQMITDYPFRNTVKLIVTTERPIAFPLHIRIPAFAAKATVNGTQAETGTFFVLERSWSGKGEMTVEFAFETQMLPRPHEMMAVQRGPLVYAVAIDEQWTALEYTQDGVERKYPYCDYEITPLSPWNYAFAEDALKVTETHIGDRPFSPDAAPIALLASMVQIPWSSKHGVCAKVPDSLNPLGDAQEIRLIPYGCTNLRMTEMPSIACTLR